MCIRDSVGSEMCIRDRDALAAAKKVSKSPFAPRP
jgi:hypothetical protein